MPTAQNGAGIHSFFDQQFPGLFFCQMRQQNFKAFFHGHLKVHFGKKQDGVFSSNLTSARFLLVTVSTTPERVEGLKTEGRGGGDI